MVWLYVLSAKLTILLLVCQVVARTGYIAGDVMRQVQRDIVKNKRGLNGQTDNTQITCQLLG